MENISHSHSGCLSPAHNCTALACYALADEWRGVYLAEEWCRRREGGHSRPLPLPLPLQPCWSGCRHRAGHRQRNLHHYIVSHAQIRGSELAYLQLIAA